MPFQVFQVQYISLESPHQAVSLWINKSQVFQVGVSLSNLSSLSLGIKPFSPSRPSLLNPSCLFLKPGRTVISCQLVLSCVVPSRLLCQALFKPFRSSRYSIRIFILFRYQVLLASSPVPPQVSSSLLLLYTSQQHMSFKSSILLLKYLFCSLKPDSSCKSFNSVPQFKSISKHFV